MNQGPRTSSSTVPIHVRGCAARLRVGSVAQARAATRAQAKSEAPSISGEASIPAR